MARARAAKDLVNIDSDERRRRVIFGSIVTVCSPRMHLRHELMPLDMHSAARPSGAKRLKPKPQHFPYQRSLLCPWCHLLLIPTLHLTT